MEDNAPTVTQASPALLASKAYTPAVFTLTKFGIIQLARRPVRGVGRTVASPTSASSVGASIVKIEDRLVASTVPSALAPKALFQASIAAVGAVTEARGLYGTSQADVRLELGHMYISLA